MEVGYSFRKIMSSIESKIVLKFESCVWISLLYFDAILKKMSTNSRQNDIRQKQARTQALFFENIKCEQFFSGEQRCQNRDFILKSRDFSKQLGIYFKIVILGISYRISETQLRIQCGITTAKNTSPRFDLRVSILTLLTKTLRSKRWEVFLFILGSCYATFSNA